MLWPSWNFSACRVVVLLLAIKFAYFPDLGCQSSLCNFVISLDSKNVNAWRHGPATNGHTLVHLPRTGSWSGFKFSKWRTYVQEKAIVFARSKHLQLRRIRYFVPNRFGTQCFSTIFHNIFLALAPVEFYKVWTGKSGKIHHAYLALPPKKVLRIIFPCAMDEPHRSTLLNSAVVRTIVEKHTFQKPPFGSGEGGKTPLERLKERYQMMVIWIVMVVENSNLLRLTLLNAYFSSWTPSGAGRLRTYSTHSSTWPSEAASNVSTFQRLRMQVQTCPACIVRENIVNFARNRQSLPKIHKNDKFDES